MPRVNVFRAAKPGEVVQHSKKLGGREEPSDLAATAHLYVPDPFKAYVEYRCVAVIVNSHPEESRIGVLVAFDCDEARLIRLTGSAFEYRNNCPRDRD